MKTEWLILCFLIIIILLSGCGVLKTSQEGNFTPDENDEALKFEYEITGTVLPDQVINMKIRLTNQVKDDVGNINLRITDFYGLKLIRQICASGSALSNCGFIATNNLCGCHFDSISSFDDEEINLIFKVPKSEDIAKIGRELKPEFTITYDYGGETRYRIPILNPNERTTTAGIEKTQTKGPIHVDIERGFTSSSEDWERNGSQFSIVIRVTDILTSRSEVEIDRTKFNIFLDQNKATPNLRFASEGICDIDKTRYIPNYNITLPMRTPLVCALEAYNEQIPWTYGEITVKYRYNYKVVKTETINVETVIA